MFPADWHIIDLGSRNSTDMLSISRFIIQNGMADKAVLEQSMSNAHLSREQAWRTAVIGYLSVSEIKIHGLTMPCYPCRLAFASSDDALLVQMKYA